MISPTLLGQLAALHELLTTLPTTIPENDCYQRYNPRLESLAWYLGRAVYVEAFWLREVVDDDDRLTKRVRPLFDPRLASDAAEVTLPPREHLLNWALEIQEEDLLRLANPAMLPAHPLLQDERLIGFIIQELALIYERMLLVLSARQLRQHERDFRPARALRAGTDEIRMAEINFGHYRLGGDPRHPHYDNEVPSQVVELHGSRIAVRPIGNAWFLGFIQAEGYQRDELWSEEGRQWRDQHASMHPWYWRRNAQGEWYEVGLNGPLDLHPDEPVRGISLHEAEAFSRWLAGLDSNYRGAVLQHEYQWEMAARNQLIEDTGRAAEWCANRFFAYDGFTPFPDIESRRDQFKTVEHSVRGSHLHSQKILRRPSLRRHAPADAGWLLNTTRLVFPPA